MHNGVTAFGYSETEIDQNQFLAEDWHATPYVSCKKDYPSNYLAPRCIYFTIRAFVDSGQASDSVTRHFRTGFVVFINITPIFVCSKKQGSCETSSFGSEFIVIKSCCDHLRGFIYTLRIFRILVEHISCVFGDNQSVLSYSSKIILF